jgi:lambda family phage portal protein
MNLRFWRKKRSETATKMVRVGRTRPKAPMSDEDWKARRWDAAKTNRLNSAHWAKALGQDVNADLESELTILRMRATHELSNNSFAAGVVETHTTDIVGPNGPTLQVQSVSDAFNEESERAWTEWWARPDLNGILSGADFIRLWIRSLWGTGEYVAQIVTDKTARGPVQARLLAIGSERLATPPAATGSDDTILGVKLTETGRPILYWIDQSSRARLGITEDFKGVPSEFVIHGFRMQEAGQVRGVPWLVPALQAMADLRDYDDQILDSARAHADWALYLSAESNDAVPIDIETSADVERRTVSALPPGWKASSHQADMPPTEYSQYRAERLREIGRPVNMPLMIVRLDSGDHTFSSATFDAGKYNNGIVVHQRWIESVALARLAKIVLSESMLSGARQPEAGFKLKWIWPAIVHGDPKKAAEAEKIRLVDTKTLTFADGVGARGGEYQSHMEQLELEEKDRKKRGITLGAAVASVQAPQQAAPTDDDDDDSPPARGNGRLTAATRMRM